MPDSTIARDRARTRRAPLAAAASLAVLLAACGSGHGASATSTTASAAKGTAIKGGTATFAELPGAPPNYIFPLMPGSYANNSNISDFQFLLYRPLYWFGSPGGTPTLNTSESMASPPVYSAGNTKVTVTLKHWLWSDGTPVTNRDVEMWVNMVKANKTNWFAYVPGAFPDDITSMTLSGTRTITFNLSRSFSPHWFTHNQLSQITPLPQQAWDRTSASGPIGNYDTTLAGARAVYSFLASQSKQLTTYASNPLWKTVDGPFSLSAFTTNGQATFVPNPRYSGPGKPRLSKFVEQPFTSDTAEYNVLRSGALTYGYIPAADAKLPLPGYTVQPWYGWSIALLFLNYHNPAAGPLFRQLYIRQAMQHLIDEPGYIRAAFAGSAATDYGPVPTTPRTSLLSSAELHPKYAFSVSAAQALLRSHGWKVTPNGTDTCQRAGTAATDCGPGIAAGTPLRLTFIYGSGNQSVTEEASFMRTDFSKAGIALKTTPTANVLSAVQPCSASQAACSWQIGDYGPVSWFYGNDSYPTGGQLFQSGASFNVGGYSSSALDTLIQATHTSASVSALHSYENYMATQLPVLWQPAAPQQLSAVKDTLHGALPQDPIENLYPQNWYLTK